MHARAREAEKNCRKIRKKFAGIKKVTTFAAPYGKRGFKSSFTTTGFQTFFENFSKKFADSKKVTTFAIPIAREGLAISRQAGFFSAKIERSLKRLTKTKYKQVPRTKNRER